MGKDEEALKKAAKEAEKAAINMSGRAKSALIRITNFINNSKQIFRKMIMQ